MRSRATSGPGSAEAAPVGDGTPSLWRPLRTPIFRNLLIADVMSDIGTFMQTVGAAWLMVSLGAGPMYVALTQPETLAGATVAAIRYVRFSPSIRILILRSGLTMFFASALLALLPSIAKNISGSPTGYGILLGCFGGGAVLGALAMQPARARWSEDAVAAGGVAILGLMTAVAGFLHAMIPLAVAMLVAGGAWIVFISVMSALVQGQAPDWVRARVLSIFMLVFQGGLAAGSALAGIVAARAGIQPALLWAGVGIMATTALGFVAKLPEATTDVSPWNHWRLPAIVKDLRLEFDEGPVLVTLEYHVARDQSGAFLEAIHDYRRVRRRDGAYRWGVYRDLEDVERFIETFLVRSWAEHLRQHERTTKADRELEDRLKAYVTGVPRVRHLVAAESDG